MVDETEQRTSSAVVKRRKNIPKKRRDAKKLKGGPGMGKKVRVSQKMQKLYRKRAREYNSDSDDEDKNKDENEDEDENENEHASESDGEDMEFERDDFTGVSDDDREDDSDEDNGVQTGITKFAEGCNAFRLAFRNIMKKHVDDKSLGPVLSEHKNLVVQKLAEEATERKVKGEAKKEKQVIEEKGHVKPENFLDSHEKFLIGVATKGVVKLFNAVNKAQMAQKGLNPSSFKDAKALTKRRKEAFITELNKATGQSAGETKASMFKAEEDNNQPAWAPLRDTYMLTNSKLKDWDKMAEEEADI